MKDPENCEIDKTFRSDLPLSGSVSGGNGVTISFDGEFTVDPSGVLARPGSFDFSVPKFLINLEAEIHINR